MNQLTREVFSFIKQSCEETYSDTFHCVSTMEAMEEALTNPSIYEKAGLITLDEAFSFAEWILGDSCTVDDLYLQYKKEENEKQKSNS